MRRRINRYSYYHKKSSRRGALIGLLASVLLPVFILAAHNSDIWKGGAIQRALTGFVGIEELESAGAAGEQTAGAEQAVADEKSLEVHFLDVGQGDATLIKCGEHAMLIDTGEEGKGTAIQYYLEKQGVERLDYMVLTHPDSDHIGSADVVITKFEVGQVLMPDYEKSNSTYRKLIETLDYKRLQPIRVRPIRVQPGSSFTLGTAVCTILGPVDEYEDSNNSSIVLLVEHGNNRFLFTGDAEEEAEADVLEYCNANGISIQADVYKAGHHGSNTSSGDTFLDAVAPKAAVISCGIDNDYGHPHEETLERLHNRGIQVFRTDEQGTVVVVSDGENLVW